MEKEKQYITFKDGKKMVFVPSGKTVIGSEFGYGDEKPTFEFKTNGFYMDITPVTNAEYLKFCEATGHHKPNDVPWKGIKNYCEKYPDYPVVNVSIRDCKAYAKWAGKRLPSESEWEYAAKGGLNDADFPWGNRMIAPGKVTLANFADTNSTDSWKDYLANDGYTYTSPVGSFEPNGYGLYDMAGNVSEYVSDIYYLYSDKDKNSVRLNDGWGGSYVCKGGCFRSVQYDLRVSRRRCILGGGDNETVGFRCVSDFETPSEPNDEPEKSVPTTQNKPLEKKQVVLCDGIELCCGAGTHLSDDYLNSIKPSGFTSIEQYVTWRSCDGGGKHKWDFSHWDRQVEMLKKAKIKWLPFIIAGPAYSLPDWFAYSDEMHGLACAEHGIESKVQSFWDKNFLNYVEEFLKEFANHYKDTSIFEGLLFGISGDFGEAIVPVWHGNWPTATAGTYHTHAGYWCKDKFAVKDFSEKMAKKYEKIENLNMAWGTDFSDFNSIAMPKIIPDKERCKIDDYTDEGIFVNDSTEDRVRIVDFIDWYRQSMTEYLGFWMQTARKYFPDTELYICTGGEAQPCHASEFSKQVKECAKVGGKVRITNEDSRYERNFVITNWVASAGNYYNADFSFEPAGGVTEEGLVCRIYNATSCGAKGLHNYSGNVMSNQKRIDIFENNIKYLTTEKPKREIGVFYSDTSVMLDSSKRPAMYSALGALRDFSDYKYVDDQTIDDGILSTVKAVILTVNGYYRQRTIKSIEQFVKDGGILASIGVHEVRLIETDENLFDLLFATSGQKIIGEGKTLFIETELAKTESTSDNETQRVIFEPLKDFLTENGVHVPDGKRDRVYVAEKGDNLLLMNYSEIEVEKEITRKNGEISKVVTKPFSIIKI